MDLIFAPEYGWQTWAAAAALAIAAAILGRAWTIPGRLGSSKNIRAGVVAFTFAAALLFAIALCGPAVARRRPKGPLHVAVLIDVSDSMLRARGSWPPLRQEIADRLRAVFDDRALDRASASVLTFRSQASVFEHSVPLRSVAAVVAQVTESHFAAGSGTNIAAGLLAAGAEIDRFEGRGAVVLVSDGNQTEGDALDAAHRLGQKGIPVYVVPIMGDTPELAIVSANLPPSVEAGRETFARGVLRNDGESPVAGQLDLVRRALRLTGQADPAADSAQHVAVQFDGRVSKRFRVPLFFDEPGLQYLDLKLTGAAGAHARRFFTYVESPPRVLSLGDTLWTRAFAPGALSLVKKEPRALTTADLSEPYEAFVVDSVPATEFAPGVLEKMANAVTTRGTGLFLMNGRHLGSGKDATNLKTYNDTPIGKLAPLLAGPRPKESDAARQIFIMIDGSGSMSGPPLQQVQQIATYVVDNLLTARDHLDVLAFTTSCQVLLSDRVLTPANKEEAKTAIQSIVAGGGTDPRECLNLLSGRKLKSCGLFFFSDGIFEGGIASSRPDCRVAAFGIGRNSFSKDDPLSELADPIPVGPDFDPANIKIPFFEKREDHFYEFGAFKPLSMRTVLPRAGAMDVPEIPLDGSATTHQKDSADLVAVRPKLVDPVLAFQETGLGNMGEFTGSLTENWVDREEGRRAIQQWLAEVLPISDRRRYLFQLSQRGQELAVEVALTPRAGQWPRVDHLDGSVEAPGAGSVDLALRPDAAVPAVFRGRLELRQSDKPIEGWLVLRESGPDALSRPQRVGIVLPPRGDVAGPLSLEAMSYGLNEELLRQLAQTGGGDYDALGSAERLVQTGESTQLRPIWQFFVVAGFASYLGAVLWHRLGF